MKILIIYNFKYLCFKILTTYINFSDLNRLIMRLAFCFWILDETYKESFLVYEYATGSIKLLVIHETFTKKNKTSPKIK